MTQIIYSSVVTPRFTMEYAAFGNGNKPLVIIPGVSLKSVLPSAPAVASQYDRFIPDHRIYLFERKKDMKPDRLPYRDHKGLRSRRLRRMPHVYGFDA